MKNRTDNFGFSLGAIITTVVVVVIAGLIIWRLWDADPTVKPPINQDENTGQGTEGHLKNYTSSVGDLTFSYPDTWQISGVLNHTSLPADQMNGEETLVRIQSAPKSSLDNFGVEFRFTTIGPEGTPYDMYGNGITETLDNGIVLWQEKRNVNYATGPAITDCPYIRIGKDKTFSIRLENQVYMTVAGSFCWGEGLETVLDYGEQVASDEWKEAIKVIKSIKFN